jgi:hypothetical protein
MLTIIETSAGTFQIDIDSRTTRQDVATNIARELSHRGARVSNSSGGGNSTWQILLGTPQGRGFVVERTITVYTFIS